MALQRRGHSLAALTLGAALAAAMGPHAEAEELMVFAAASLTDALEELAQEHEASSGNPVVLNLGASSDLARQIRIGAPADVFLSADRAQMDAVVGAGLVRAEDQVPLLGNTLVVIVPRSSRLELTRADDLRGVERLALADPAVVPAGVYARRWLESLGSWPAVSPHVVATLNVRAALDAVETENADAGIVYKTDAAMARRSRIAFEVPREDGPPIVYMVAPLASSPPAAHAFVRFLQLPAARAIFERHGFVVLPDAPARGGDGQASRTEATCAGAAHPWTSPRRG